MTLAVHNPPSGSPTSTFYTAVTVNGVAATPYATDLGHFINFSTDQDVTIVVTFNASITTATVSPQRKNVPVTISGNTATFTLSGNNKNGNFVVLINDPNLTDDAQVPTWAPFFVFANPLEVNPPTASGTNLLYLGPGNWYVATSTSIVSGTGTVSDNYYDIANGKTLYLAPGAVLRGKLKFGSDTSGNSGGGGVTSGKLYGRGIVDATYAPTFGRVLRINNSSNVTIDGLCFVNKQHWAVAFRMSDTCTANNIKVISQRYWTGSAMGGTPDGIDCAGSSNITVTNSFVRSYDDSITVKADVASPGGWAKNVSNITYDGMVIYQGWGGNAMEIGFETPNPITNVTFKNIDVIFKKSRSGDVASVANIRDALSINAGQAGAISNVLYDKIWVESTDPNFIGIVTAIANAPVSNVTYRNIFFNQQPLAKVVNIQGFNNTTSKISGVTFDKVRFGGLYGSVVTGASQINMSPATDAAGNRDPVTFTNVLANTPIIGARQQSITIKAGKAQTLAFDYTGDVTGYAVPRLLVTDRHGGTGWREIGAGRVATGKLYIDLSVFNIASINNPTFYKLEFIDNSTAVNILSIGTLYVDPSTTTTSNGYYDSGNLIASGSTTLYRANGLVQKIVLTGSGGTVNIDRTDVSWGSEMHIEIVQDATGSRTFSWGSNVKVGSGSLTTTANAVDVLSFTFDGTNWRETARSLNQS